jgi:hypothetical protein
MASLAGLVSKKNFASIAYAPDESAATGPSDFARRQLEKFGWKEGRGLGKDEDGSATFIAVQRKADNLGLGAKTVGQVLQAAIAKSVAAVPDSDESSGSGEDESEDPDMKVFRACGGMRFGMRSQAPQTGKLARMEAADAAFRAEMAAKATPIAAVAPAAAKARAPSVDATVKRKRGDENGAATDGGGADAAKAARKAEKKAARKVEKAASKQSAEKAEAKAAKKAAKKANLDQAAR